MVILGNKQARTERKIFDELHNKIAKSKTLNFKSGNNREVYYLDKILVKKL